MSTAINSTHQQDRVAQQKLVQARQSASAQGQGQGAAFSRLLSLACDEDTDLDAMKQRASAQAWEAGDTGTQIDANGKTKRKPGVPNDTDSAGATEADKLPPAAQANATLMALLERALKEQAPDTDNATTEAASAASTPTGGAATAEGADPTALATAALPATDADGLSADAAADAGTLAPTPGKAVRELARQLGALRSDQAPGHTGADAPHPGGPAWARPTADALATATPAAWAAADGLANAGPAAGHPAARLQASSEAMQDSAGADESTTPGGDTARIAGAASTADGGGHQSQAGLGGDSLGGSTEANGTDNTTDTGTATSEPWQQQWTDAMDQMAQQVSYWVAQGGVRQATLRVGGGPQQTMDVKLSMKKGQAEIEFRTDHEAARSAITQGGTEVLRELLAQSGIDLGSVSVGGQASGGGGQEGQAPSLPGGSGRAGPADSSAPTTELRPRLSSSTGLDLYV